MKNRIRIDSCHVAAMKWLRLSLFLLFGLVLIPMYGQSDITIRGKVVSVTDQSELIGVNVLLKGTSSGTITDVDGNFQLKVSPNATLVFSNIGYNDLELNLTPGKTQYTVAMTEDSQLIDEVVVVGYGVQKKKLVTGATVQVKGDDIARMNTVSPLTAKQRQPPGEKNNKTSDYMEYLLYAVMKLLLDIYLLAKSGGNIGLAYEGTLIVRLAIAVHTFLR